MITILKGNLIEAKSLDELIITQGGYLVLEEGNIVGVFQQLPGCYAGVPITDYGDKLILQAFCDMHLHAPQYPMLGLGMDLPLLDWLNTYTFPVEAQFSDTQKARKIYSQLAANLVKNGTTRVSIFSSIHRPSTLILMEELENAGITGYVGKVNMDRNGGNNYQETTEESKAETLRWLDACAQFSGIKPILTPRFTPTCTNELMAWLGEVAHERGIFVQSHLSENNAEIEWVRQLHPQCTQYWETYDQYGLLTDHTIMAHCVYSDAREQEAMRVRNVLIAHCPDSNINICSGFVPVREMLDRGLWVGLGSDIAGGAQLPMMQVMTACIRMSKAQRITSEWQTPFLTVSEAYYLATTSGARYFGAGAGFAAGDKLHAVVLDDSDFPDMLTLNVKERFERAVYLADDRNIVAVYGNGKKIK
ncbi:MAG: amidohydrolase family protein [Clostridia bacterium]